MLRSVQNIEQIPTSNAMHVGGVMKICGQYLVIRVIVTRSFWDRQYGEKGYMANFASVAI